MATEAVAKLKKLQAQAQEALDDASVARRDARELTRFQRLVHFWALVVRSFLRNRCPTRASALAYASLLAIVPMLAVVIGVSSGLLKQQGEEPIQRFVAKLIESVTPSAPRTYSRLEDMPAADEEVVLPADPDAEAVAKAKLAEEIRRQTQERIMEFVGNIRSGTLSVTGVIALLIVAIMMLARIEDTFNDIWGVTRGRSWYLRVVLYWAAITLGPILWASATALTSGPYLAAVERFVSGFGPFGRFAWRVALFVLPYLMWSLGFGVFYLLMPNTRVERRAAAVGGIVAGVLWQLNQEFSVFYVSRVVTNTQIYGGLAAIPVFMIGLYVSWLILLFGAQVAYAFQNRQAYLQERQVETVNQRSREFIALRLMTTIAADFDRGDKPSGLTRLAGEAGVPTRLATQLLTGLEAAGLIVPVEGAAGEAAYVPARPLNQITADDVLKALRVGNGRDLATREDETRAVVWREFERIGAAEGGVASSVSLQELVDRLGLAAAGRHVPASSPGPAVGEAVRPPAKELPQVS